MPAAKSCLQASPLALSILQLLWHLLRHSPAAQEVVLWPIAIYPFPLMAYKPILCPSHSLNSHLHEEMFLAHKARQPQVSLWCLNNFG